MAKYEKFWLEGIVPAVFTPFDSKRELDLSKIEPYCEFLLKNDIKAIYVNGGTGEGPSLTLNERKDILDKWIAVSKGRLKIVVHVGGTNPKECKELTVQAAKAGADAIATLPTLFFKPQTIDSLISYCKSLASLAPELPFYYYHIPDVTAVNLNMEDFMIKARKEIPNLIGVKFTSRDLFDMIGVRNAGKFNILYGYNQQLLGGLTMGADGSICTLHNVMPGVYHRMIRYFENGDMESARNEQIKIQQLCKLVGKYGTMLSGHLSAFKMLMSSVGLDLGPTREPMRTMSEDESKQFMQDISALGFFDWKPVKF